MACNMPADDQLSAEMEIGNFAAGIEITEQNIRDPHGRTPVPDTSIRKWPGHAAPRS